MAEGGYDTPGENENTGLDWEIDHDDDDEEEVDTTIPFQPGAASTPYHGGEEHEMHTLPREQSGFDPEDIPLLTDFTHPDDREGMVAKAREWIKRLRPRADFSRLDPIGFGKKKNRKCRQICYLWAKGWREAHFQTRWIWPS